MLDFNFNKICNLILHKISFVSWIQIATVLQYCMSYLALNAPEVEHMKVTGQCCGQWGKGAERGNATLLWNDWQCQHLMVQDGRGHVTQQRGEADWSTVNSLQRRTDCSKLAAYKS